MLKIEYFENALSFGKKIKQKNVLGARRQATKML